jgi:hypothetical protein
MYKPVEVFKKNTDPTTLWEVGYSAQQGHRPSMEDEHSVDLWFNQSGCPCLLAGVFDGHFGNQCSKYLVGSMPEQLKDLLANVSQPSEVTNTFQTTFLATDQYDNFLLFCFPLLCQCNSMKCGELCNVQKIPFPSKNPTSTNFPISSFIPLTPSPENI